ENSHPTIINCIFDNDNIVFGHVEGEGIYNLQSNPLIINCTFLDHSEMYNVDSSHPVITNSIIWDPGHYIVNTEDSSATVTYSNIHWEYPGEGNISADPEFAGDGDYHLQEGSICIDAGNKYAVPDWITTDIDGDLRIYNNQVDMGADETPYDVLLVTLPATNITPETVILHAELTDVGIRDSFEVYFEYGYQQGDYQFSTPSQIVTTAGKVSFTLENLYNGTEYYFRVVAVTTYSAYGDEFHFETVNIDKMIFVDDDAFGDPSPGDPCISDPYENGTIHHPFDTIQEGIIAAANSDIVNIAAGIYTGDGNRDIDYLGRAIAVRGAGPELTVIDCQGMSRGVSIKHFDNTAQVSLEGVSIINGRFLGDEFYIYRGGGIYIEDAAPVVQNCVFRNNQAVEGGGMFIFIIGKPRPEPREVYQPQIINCRFEDNLAEFRGGAMGFEGYPDYIYPLMCEPHIIDCVIQGNQSLYYGGGVCIGSGAQIMIDHCEFLQNDADINGGGICLIDPYYYNVGNAKITNSVFIGNHTSGSGGALANLEPWGNYEIRNCTVIQNTADLKGGGIYNSIPQGGGGPVRI
ncbi:MAG: hypothetical protein GY869_10745, partial [Planctomycetes bacterium]|nr:hypothetical protein [Planctomycetota bacterium]